MKWDGNLLDLVRMFYGTGRAEVYQVNINPWLKNSRYRISCNYNDIYGKVRSKTFPASKFDLGYCPSDKGFKSKSEAIKRMKEYLRETNPKTSLSDRVRMMYGTGRAKVKQVGFGPFHNPIGYQSDFQIEQELETKRSAPGYKERYGIYCQYYVGSDFHEVDLIQSYDHHILQLLPYSHFHEGIGFESKDEAIKKMKEFLREKYPKRRK